MARLIALYLLTSVLLVKGFYIPLHHPTNFCTEEMKEKNNESDICQSDVFVHVNKLDSLKKILPFEYSRFDFCKLSNDSKVRDPVENLGQVVFGERLRTSAYEIAFAKNETYKELCTITYSKDKKEDKEKLDFLRERIHESYMHQWVIDNMPVTWSYHYTAKSDETIYMYTTQIPVGCIIKSDGERDSDCYPSRKLALYQQDDIEEEPRATYLYNYMYFILSYHSGTEGNQYTDGRIVRAEIELYSCESIPCYKPLKLPEKLDKDFTIPYFYSVHFQLNNSIHWATRWNYIFVSIPFGMIQTFLVIFGIIMILFGMFSSWVSLLVQIKGPKAVWVGLRWMAYNPCKPKNLPDWKPAFLEIFRPPAAIMLLSVFVGNGAQILIAALVVLLIYCLGFLSPANRGALSTAILVVPVLTSFVAGCVSATLYRMMGGLRWKSNVLMTSFFVPGIAFGVFFTLNLFLWYAGSSAAIPFTTLLALLCLWFGISVPLTFLGAFLSPVIRLPVYPGRRTPLEISKSLQRRLIFGSVYVSIIGGLYPFGVCISPLVNAFKFTQEGQIYYMPGFDMLPFLLLLMMSVMFSIVFSASLLPSVEKSRWWWRSFFTTGSAAFYFLLFMTFYFFFGTTISGFLSAVLFFGYTFIMVFLFLLMTGAVGFLSSLFFTWKMHFYVRSLADANLLEQQTPSDQMELKDMQKEESGASVDPLKEISTSVDPQKETVASVDSKKEIIASVDPQKEIAFEVPPKEIIAEDPKEGLRTNNAVTSS